MSYLIGDIGGTHVRLRLIGCSPTIEARCLSIDRTGPEAAISRFLQPLQVELRRAIQGAYLAVAGPVHGGRASMTNNDWEFYALELARTFDFEFVELINDFEAVALAVPHAAVHSDRNSRRWSKYRDRTWHGSGTGHVSSP